MSTISYVQRNFNCTCIKETQNSYANEYLIFRKTTKSEPNENQFISQ